jgi:hypothetical protein
MEFPIEDDPAVVDPDPTIKPMPEGTVIVEDRYGIDPVVAAYTPAAGWAPVPVDLANMSLAGGFTVADTVVLIAELFDDPVTSADSREAATVSSPNLKTWSPTKTQLGLQALHGHIASVAPYPGNGGLVVTVEPTGVRLVETHDGSSWAPVPLPDVRHDARAVGAAAIPGGVAFLTADAAGSAQLWLRRGAGWEAVTADIGGVPEGLAALDELTVLGVDANGRPMFTEIEGIAG